MAQFKVGDTVRRCPSQYAGQPELWAGRDFTVDEVRPGAAGWSDIKMSPNPSPGFDGYWDSHRFELAPVTTRTMILPDDPKARKNLPITTGVLDYFPRALAEVAKCSKIGNDQHNPGQPLHWDKSKSTDHADCIARHLIDRDSFDTDGIRHAAKLAWRSLALLEVLLEKEKQ